MSKGNRLFEVKTRYPQIYVFEDKANLGWLKVGFTTRQNAEDRVREQFNTRLQIDKDPYILHLVVDAIDKYGNEFMDHDVHNRLVNRGVIKRGEFFKTDIDTVRSAILAVKENRFDIEDRTETFSMRDEQAQAVKQTKEYFRDSFDKYPNHKPKYLWNAKMRFGKTFAAYQLAKQMDFKRVLVLTYKPAVEDSWRTDLLSHIDFMGWQFVSRKEDNLEDLDRSKPFVYFASFQDILGVQDDGQLKKHNEWVHKEDWDMIIQDEYHYGAWRDSAKELLESDFSEEVVEEDKDAEDLIDGKCLLYLSGTPFRAIDSGEFADNQVFNWTYADEQKAKADYEGPDSPYEALPEMNILTYQLPDKIKNVAMQGEFDEFSLSYFFKAEGEYEDSRFINEGEVQRWLNLIEGKHETEDDIVHDSKLRRAREQVDFPFARNSDLHKHLRHMLWLLPNVSSVYAMKNLLEDPVNRYFNSFEIIVAAGDRTGSGAEALIPVREAMDNPLETKTITLSCGKLTTGVTVPPWTGIFMLRTLNSPESYFQSAFRAQSPWTQKNEHGEREVLKHKCFVLDFDPNRALRQIANYATNLDSRDVTSEEKISEFIKYLPILAYDGFGMEKIDAAGLLDISIGETTSTLLARGWNNALILNLEEKIIRKVFDNPEALRIVNSIESFKTKKFDKSSDRIITSTNVINKLQTKREDGEKLSKDETKELNDERRAYRKERELLRDKLITLATRIPLFMYLTDYREEKLTDVITKLQPDLFRKSTGLSIDDFEALVELGVFNSELMNDSVYKFRTYEDSSMSYSGINRHEGETNAGFDEKLMAERPGKPYTPIYKAYSDSIVYFDDNKFTLYKGSKIKSGEGYRESVEDVSFDMLSEAAKFITDGYINDYSFFN